MVKQPYSRESAGFFDAVLSVVARRDAWPDGWYNCPMEFLKSTG